MKYEVKNILPVTASDQNVKSVVDLVFSHQKDELLKELKKMPMKVKKVVEFDRTVNSPKPWEDPLANVECISTLTIDDLDEKKVTIEPPKVVEKIVPVYKTNYKPVKGFWNKLKLAFSKKQEMYVEIPE